MILSYLEARGLALSSLGKFQEAITWYDKALETSPTDTFILENKAVALSELGKYDEAITYYDKVLTLEPNNANALDGKKLALTLTKQ